MTIKKRIIFVFSFIAMNVLLCGAVGIYAFSQAKNKYHEVIETRVPAIRVLGDIKAMTNRLLLEANSFAFSPIMADKKNFFHELKEYEESKEQLRNLAKKYKNLRYFLYSKLSPHVELLIEDTDELVEIRRKNVSLIPNKKNFERVEFAEEAFERVLDEMIEEERKNLVYAERIVNRQADRLLYVYVLSTIVIISIAIASGLYIKNKVSQSILDLNDVVKSFSKGHFDIDLVIEANDELGELTKSFYEIAKDLRHSQSQIVQSAKLSSLGVMSSGIAHELNNPLTFIKGYNQVIQALLKNKGSVTSEDIGDLTTEINQGVDRMKKIIQRFRDFSRVSPNNYAKCSVEDVINKSFKYYESLFELKSIKISLELSKEETIVYADPLRLQQVFINLISNSRDALMSSENQEEKCITVKTELLDSSVRIKFSDNGPGIDTDDIDNIFDPFFTKKEVGEGVGLGLSAIHGIIKDFNGEISVKSGGPHGVEFLILLPMVKEVKSRNIA